MADGKKLKEIGVPNVEVVTQEQVEEAQKRLIINWYPGHMNRTRKLIAEHLNRVDMVIEMRDARIPLSSCNPMLQQLIQSKPILILLNKADLADPEVTRQWIEKLQTPTQRLLAVSSKEPKIRQKIVAECKKLLKDTSSSYKKSGRSRIRTMITGIPNVGKSTLINTLSSSAKAKTGNKVGVTVDIQSIRVEGGIDLLDTPGVLWPKIEEERQGVFLVAVGSVKDEVVEIYRVAVQLAAFFLENYPDALKTRFGFQELPSSATDLIEAVGKKRGCIKAKGIVDLEQAAFRLLIEFREGRLGQISLDLPQMF